MCFSWYSRHVEPDDRALVVEHELGERPRELGLAHAGRSEEDERADRPVRVLQAGASAAERVRHRLDRDVLADDALVQALLHVHELLDLALEQAVDRDARPLRDDRRDILLVDHLLDHGLDARGSSSLELLLGLRDQAVADLCDAREIALALGSLRLGSELVDVRVTSLGADEHVLLVLPAPGKLVSAAWPRQGLAP